MTESMMLDLTIALIASLSFVAMIFIAWCYFCQVYEDKLREETEINDN